MTRWSTSKSALLFALATAGIAGTEHDATAGFIMQSDFTNATLTDLDNLGPSPAQLTAPYKVGIYSFTTDDGMLRYTHFGVNNSNALGDNTDLGFIDIRLKNPVFMFGFLVGLAGEAQTNTQRVDFFDKQNHLLGTTTVGRDGGFSFVGFQSKKKISRVLVTDLKANSTVVTVDNLEVQSQANGPSSTAVQSQANGPSSTAGILMDEGRYVRDAILGRMIQSSDGDGGRPQVAAFGTDNIINVASLKSNLAFWTREWGDFDGNGNASSTHKLSGFVSGMDARIGGNWRIGAATISQSENSVDALQTHVATVSVAAYAGGSVGPLALRSGGAWSWHNIDISSGMAFPGPTATEQASLSGDTEQVFGEAAYPMLMGPAAIEPFAGLALVHVGTGSFQERGGVAPLQGSSEDVGYSTLGLRVGSTIHMQDAAITPRASIAWQHAFNLVSDSALAFSSMDTGFGGLPLAQNNALVDVGFDLNFSPTASIGMSYAGRFANTLLDNSIRGRFTWVF